MFSLSGETIEMREVRGLDGEWTANVGPSGAPVPLYIGASRPADRREGVDGG